jgi:hypothetical protein
MAVDVVLPTLSTQGESTGARRPPGLSKTNDYLHTMCKRSSYQCPPKQDWRTKVQYLFRQDRQMLVDGFPQRQIIKGQGSASTWYPKTLGLMPQQFTL